MALLTVNIPAFKQAGPPMRDITPEGGDSWFDFLTKAKTMFTELFTIAAGQAGATAVDFGTYPGAFNTSVAVTGQTDLVAGSNIRAWLVAKATDDHSIDEHWADPPIITVGNVEAGVGFTIYAISRDGGRNYGQWTVQWKWQ